MKEEMSQINEGIIEHEAQKITPPEFITYEKMTEKELLAEYTKETDFIKGERRVFRWLYENGRGAWNRCREKLYWR